MIKIVKDPYGKLHSHAVVDRREGHVPECGAVAVEPPAPPQCEKITLGTDTLFDFDRSDSEAGVVAPGSTKLASDIGKAERVSVDQDRRPHRQQGHRSLQHALGPAPRRHRWPASWSAKGVPRVAKITSHQEHGRIPAGRAQHPAERQG
jgi:hypothetical protein